MAATLSHFPTPQFISLFPSSHSHQTNSLSSFLYHTSHSRRPILLCLASTNKSRPSRKVMSNEDLCNVLREFVASVGLPEGHVPSTKELTQHGRKDLANIVRRRGHKLIKELLYNSQEAATEGSDSENLSDELNRTTLGLATGQEEKLDDLLEEPADVPLISDNSANRHSFPSNYESANGADDERNMSSLLERVDDSANGDCLVTNDESAITTDDQSHISMESPTSLQEKVENFIKYGQLDTVEDDMCGDLQLNDVKEGEGLSNGEIIVQSVARIHDAVGTRFSVGAANNIGLNGTLTAPRTIAPPAAEDNFIRDDHLSMRGQSDSDLDKDMSTEASEMENEAEINHLKNLLHQKELELCRLKGEIEKEKQALSILQTKAEHEISKAQKLISEKDAELHAAEESLSGLVEAKIQYLGEGQIVEVAGSFNGWHQRIKMEPQPSTAILDPIGSRKYRHWSTTLWLYPGVYEIKFIVDGNWIVDPQRESTNKGGIENNILRVDR